MKGINVKGINVKGINVIDHPDAEHPARPAATLALLRDGPDELEVLMIHRGSATAFGGMWSFPGGVIDDDDIPIGTAPDPLPAARRAAVRETQEETGLVVDVDSLVWWSHWLPPGRGALSSKRFSTWFFVAVAQADSTPTARTSLEPDASSHADPIMADPNMADPNMADPNMADPNVEVVAARWLAPSVALGLHEHGELLLAPPTYVTLSQLLRYGDALTAVRSVAPSYFATEVAFDGTTRLCLWEGDVGYGGGDATAIGPRHRLAMDETNGWRYLKTTG